MSCLGSFSFGSVERHQQVDVRRQLDRHGHERARLGQGLQLPVAGTLVAVVTVAAAISSARKIGTPCATRGRRHNEAQTRQLGGNEINAARSCHLAFGSH
jgi:hypothetical protein